eukprot:8137653-Ditylum_brightwellii.AAC.1
MTAHDAYTGMPQLKDYVDSSDDKDYFSFSDSDSDANSDDTNYNRKMLAQPARNENKNLIGIGNGGGNFDSNNDNSSFLIQDTNEHNMAQSLQEDDHVMPSDEEKQYS